MERLCASQSAFKVFKPLQESFWFEFSFHVDRHIKESRLILVAQGWSFIDQ